MNESDLAYAIEQGIIAGAGVDVFENEPIPHDNPLLAVKKSDRLVLLPHIAWASTEARERLMGMVANNIGDWQRTRHS